MLRWFAVISWERQRCNNNSFTLHHPHTLANIVIFVRIFWSKLAFPLVWKEGRAAFKPLHPINWNWRRLNWPYKYPFLLHHHYIAIDSLRLIFLSEYVPRTATDKTQSNSWNHLSLFEMLNKIHEISISAKNTLL